MHKWQPANTDRSCQNWLPTSIKKRNLALRKCENRTNSTNLCPDKPRQNILNFHCEEQWISSMWMYQCVKSDRIEWTAEVPSSLSSNLCGGKKYHSVPVIQQVRQHLETSPIDVLQRCCLIRWIIPALCWVLNQHLHILASEYQVNLYIVFCSGKSVFGVIR